MYTSDCVWNCFAFVIALRWAIAFQAITASGPTRTWVPADGADAGVVGDAAQALTTATASSTTMERRGVAIKHPPLVCLYSHSCGVGRLPVRGSRTAWLSGGRNSVAWD